MFSLILQFVWRCLKQIAPVVFKLNLKVFSWLVLVGANFLIDKMGSNMIKSKMSCKIVWPHFSYLVIYFSVLPLERMCTFYYDFPSKHFAFVCSSGSSGLGCRRKGSLCLTLFSFSFLLLCFCVVDTWTKFQIFVLK